MDSGNKWLALLALPILALVLFSVAALVPQLAFRGVDLGPITLPLVVGSAALALVLDVVTVIGAIAERAAPGWARALAVALSAPVILPVVALLTIFAYTVLLSTILR